MPGKRFKALTVVLMTMAVTLPGLTIPASAVLPAQIGAVGNSGPSLDSSNLLTEIRQNYQGSRHIYRRHGYNNYNHVNRYYRHGHGHYNNYGWPYYDGLGLGFGYGYPDCGYGYNPYCSLGYGSPQYDSGYGYNGHRYYQIRQYNQKR